MSADNGIYIGKFKDGYRTTIGFSVDNLSFYKEGTFLWIKTIRDFFKDGQFSKNFDEAMKYATELEDSYGWTEYGINEVGDFSEYNIFDEEDTFEITEDMLLQMGFEKIELLEEEDENEDEIKYGYHLELDKGLNLYFDLNGGVYNVVLTHGNFGTSKTYLQINSLLELKNFLYVFDLGDGIDKE